MNCFFVDLFVRASNGHAIELYKRLGYHIYRRVLNYYNSNENEGEDAFGAAHDLHPALFIAVLLKQKILTSTCRYEEAIES